MIRNGRRKIASTAIAGHPSSPWALLTCLRRRHRHGHAACEPGPAFWSGQPDPRSSGLTTYPFAPTAPWRRSDAIYTSRGSFFSTRPRSDPSACRTTRSSTTMTARLITHTIRTPTTMERRQASHRRGRSFSFKTRATTPMQWLVSAEATDDNHLRAHPYSPGAGHDRFHSASDRPTSSRITRQGGHHRLRELRERGPAAFRSPSVDHTRASRHVVAND